MKNKKNHKTFLSKKQYKSELNNIYKLKNNDEFEKQIKDLYKKSEINECYLRNRLIKILNFEKKSIDKASLIFSSLLSALATSIINSDAIKEVLNKDFGTIFKAFVFVLGIIILISVGLVIFTFIILAGLQKFFKFISDKDIEKYNIEVDVIIDRLPKKSLRKLIGKVNKKELIVHFIRDTIIGIIAAVIVSVIVWFTT